MRKKYLACAISCLLPATGLIAEERSILVEDSFLQLSEEIYEPDEIHMSPTSDAGEALRNIPGVSGIRMGGRGIDPIIRGQSQTRLNILIDGAYIHGGCPNRMDPPTAYNGIDTFENITVMKGSQTVLYGGGGSGGTVLFEREKPEFTADKKYMGSFSAGFKDNSEYWETSIDVAAGNSDGYLRGLATYSDADNYEDGDGNKVSSAFTGKEGTVIAGYNFDAKSNIELSYTANREDDIYFAGAGMDSPWTDNDLYQLKFNTENAVGPFSAIKAEIYSSDVDHLMDNYSLRKKGMPNMYARAPSTSDTDGGRVIATFQQTAHTWNVGVDYQDNTRKAERYSAMSAAAANSATTPDSILWPDAELKQTGIFAEMERPLDENNRVKVGLRYDYVEANISKADDTAQFNTPMGVIQYTPRDLYNGYYDKSASTSTTENNVGGFIRLEHRLDENAALYGSLSRSVRTADATERYISANSPMATMRWIGNTNLEPEAHHQIEIGYQRRQANWDFDVSIYYNDVSDFILRDRAHDQSGIKLDDNASIYRNVDAELYGFETGLNMRWNDNWSSVFTLAYVHAENTSDDRAIAQTPPLEGTINLEYNKNDWRIGGLIRAQDNQSRVEDNINEDSGLDAEKTPGWATLDIFGSYEGHDNLTVSAGVNNLFDLTYAYHVNRASTDPFNPDAIQVNEPGREVWLKAKLLF